MKKIEKFNIQLVSEDTEASLEVALDGLSMKVDRQEKERGIGRKKKNRRVE